MKNLKRTILGLVAVVLSLTLTSCYEEYEDVRGLNSGQRAFNSYELFMVRSLDLVNENIKLSEFRTLVAANTLPDNSNALKAWRDAEKAVYGNSYIVDFDPATKIYTLKSIRVDKNIYAVKTSLDDMSQKGCVSTFYFVFVVDKPDMGGDPQSEAKVENMGDNTWALHLKNYRPVQFDYDRYYYQRSAQISAELEVKVTPTPDLKVPKDLYPNHYTVKGALLSRHLSLSMRDIEMKGEHTEPLVFGGGKFCTEAKYTIDVKDLSRKLEEKVGVVIVPLRYESLDIFITYKGVTRRTSRQPY